MRGKGERFVMDESHKKIAVIGGTGALGGGLAWRLAQAGFPVTIGSRTLEKAQDAARALQTEFGDKADIEGLENAEAAAAGDVIVLTVPFASHDTTLNLIAPYVADKIVIDATVPLVPPKVARVQLPPEGSAALAAKAKLPSSLVVSAFQNAAAHKLRDAGDLDCDILVSGDNVAAREQVISLVNAIGMRGIHCGPLDNAVVAEALTSVLIGINKRYGVDGAGIRITGDLTPTKDA